MSVPVITAGDGPFNRGGACTKATIASIRALDVAFSSKNVQSGLVSAKNGKKLISEVISDRE
jgi:hypothetical protein